MSKVISTYVIAVSGLIILSVFFLFKTSASGANIQSPQSIPTITPTVIPTVQPTPTPAISLNIELPKKQILKATYSQGKGLEPTEFTVKTGIPVRFEVYAEIDGVGCMGSIMIPYLSNSVQQFIKGQTNVFEFTPEKPGEYEITCAMGIPHGSIVVK